VISVRSKNCLALSQLSKLIPLLTTQSVPRLDHICPGPTWAPHPSHYLLQLGRPSLCVPQLFDRLPNYSAMRHLFSTTSTACLNHLYQAHRTIKEHNHELSAAAYPTFDCRRWHGLWMATECLQQVYRQLSIHFGCLKCGYSMHVKRCK
jgi:hypothetical protein